MLVSIDKRTGAYADILARRRFAINILPADAGIADAFGGKTAAKGADRFEPGAGSTLASGAPVLTSALGVFDCEVEDVIDRGGVAVVIGRVIALASKGEGKPLIAFRGSSLPDPRLQPGAGRTPGTGEDDVTVKASRSSPAMSPPVEATRTRAASSASARTHGRLARMSATPRERWLFSTPCNSLSASSTLST